MHFLLLTLLLLSGEPVISGRVRLAVGVVASFICYSKIQQSLSAKPLVTTDYKNYSNEGFVVFCRLIWDQNCSVLGNKKCR